MLRVEEATHEQSSSQTCSQTTPLVLLPHPQPGARRAGLKAAPAPRGALGRPQNHRDAAGNGYFSFLHLRSDTTQTRLRAAVGRKGLCSTSPFELAIRIVLLFSHKRVFGNFVFYNNEPGISVVMHIVIISLCFVSSTYFFIKKSSQP